jgi:hypothetical protein
VAAAVAEVVVEVVAVVAVDDEDGVQWRRWGGRSMAVAAFDGGGGNGLRIGNVEAKMVIDAIGGGWFDVNMAIDTSGVAGGDNGHQL